MIEARSLFDAELMRKGPPAVFSIDAKGRIGLDDMRTREHYNRVQEPGVFEPCHCVYRDTVTGFVQYLLVTSPQLCVSHPRAEITRFDDAQAALACVAGLGDPPVSQLPL